MGEWAPNGSARQHHAMTLITGACVLQRLGSARRPSTTPGAGGGTGTVRPGEESGFKSAGAGSGAICPFPGALAAKRGAASSVQERPSIAAVYTRAARLSFLDVESRHTFNPVSFLAQGSTESPRVV